MVSVVQQDSMWYAVRYSGDHIRSDLTNVVCSYQFKDKISAEIFATGVLLCGEKEANNEDHI